MGKKLRRKKIDLLTDAKEIAKAKSKKGKISQTKEKRRDRRHQKEIVRQIAMELIKLSEDVFDDVDYEEQKPRQNEVIYSIKPVN